MKRIILKLIKVGVIGTFTIIGLIGCGGSSGDSTVNDGSPSNGLTVEEENIRLEGVENIVLSDTLIWSNVEHLNPYTVDYFTAESKCKSMTLADYTDWRLPVESELYALTKDSSLKQQFDYISEFGYWTSETVSAEISSYLNQLDYKVVVKMDDGSTVYTNKQASIHHVICVRKRPI